MKHPDDGKFVVVQGGQRLSELHADQTTAIQEAQKQQKLKESQGQAKQAPVEVKQNLYG